MISVRSFGVSSAHEGMWRAQKMAPDTLNHAMTTWEVGGALDPVVMESAFRHVLDEAEVLRVGFVEDGGELRQVPRELGGWRPFSLDLSAEADPGQAARDELADMLRQPFDLERDLLFRLGVVRLAAARWLVVIAYHHLISDGYGVGGLLSRRLAEVYTALVRGSDVPEPPHPWDVGSFAARAGEYRASQRFTDDLEFWRDYLKDAPAPAQVPHVVMSDSTRSALSEPLDDGDRWSEVAGGIGMVSRALAVPRAEADAWTEAAKSMGMWLSSMLTAAAAVYFRHRCERPEFLFSLAVGNRSGAAGTTPGLAVNVVPVRVKVPLAATFIEVADAVGDEMYEIFDHLACHYSDIQRASGAVLSGRGGFGAVMNIVEFVERIHFDGVPARYLGGTTGAFDELSFGFCGDGTPQGDLYLRLDAPAGLYSGAELRVIGEELITYVRAVVACEGRLPVGALDVVSGAERERVLVEPNDTAAPVPGLTVPELFARQVERAPDAVAVVSGDSQISYRVLDELSGRVAEALRRRGVGSETVVAVALPRSVDLVVALLGVVKAGGAYLLIDPTSSVERIRPVVTGAAVRALLTGTTTADVFSAGLDVPAIVFDDACSATTDDVVPDVSVPARRDGLLAVMHGSGSAGAPAGVAVTHRNLERYVMDRHWRDGGHRVVLWHAPHSYDVLALEVWTPLLNGGRIVVAPPGRLDADVLAAMRAAHQISTVWLPAGVFAAIATERPESVAGLREVWTGGDRPSLTAVRRVREACPEVAIVHGHGAAETSGFIACHRLTADDREGGAGGLGRPMDNTALYVLGPGLAPVPAGVTGELYVAGSGVARGYTGRPGQTAERFVPCPFGPAGGLMYRTGDRARWGVDGRLEYAGRAGVQARIRGVAVEPVEVEAVLSEYPGVAQSAVVVREDDSGQQRLVAYAVPLEPRVGLSAEELRRFAAGRLPEALMPSAVVVLERLPVTAGGIVDRVSLPDPESGGRKYRGPRNATERVLCTLVAEVLERDRVGIDDDFFDLGGNSLRAIRLVGLIRAELNQEVSIRTLFVARTVAGLSGMWQDFARSRRPALHRRTKDGEAL
ncbi:amino acid adenylation domain-containing protein [Spirillospora sp. NPDC048911]|uniref:non-ribosomal peptide synthetase n=1 Tax=Spirillospora sp. NPDC048911 TaxID=3364527 RepID=UPI0037174A02